MSSPSPLLGVVLAGGAASRMSGGDKGKVEIFGKRLIDHVLERLAPQVDTIVIAGPSSYATGFPAVPDFEDKVLGPVAGLYTAVNWSKTHEKAFQQFVAVPVDMPFIRSDCCELLVNAGENAYACDGEHAFSALGLWSMENLAFLFNEPGFPEAPSLRWVSRQVGSIPVKFPSPSGLNNLNTADDVSVLARTKQKS